MADSAVPISPGAGASVDTYQLANLDHQQVVREARGQLVTQVTWTVSTVPLVPFVVADPARVMMLIVSRATSRVYLRLSATLPFPRAAVYDQYLDPGDRWEVPIPLSTLPLSAVGDQGGGTLAATLVSVV